MRGARPWLTVLAVAIVAAGTWSLQRSAAQEPGPLAPLDWLVGGAWRPETGEHPARSFAWSGAGGMLRETRRGSDGAPAGDVTYHWHHAKQEIAVYGVLPGSHLEGVLRADPSGALELQWKLWGADGEVLRYRERLSPQAPGRMAWTLWRLDESEEILDREASFVRKPR